MKDNGTQLRSELTSCIRQMQAMANQPKKGNPDFEVPGMAETQNNLVVSGHVFQMELPERGGPPPVYLANHWGSPASQHDGSSLGRQNSISPGAGGALALPEQAGPSRGMQPAPGF